MIYFVQTSDNQYLKIGKADDVAKRLSGLQTGQPQKLKLLATMPGGHEEERAIHQRFSHLRTHGEWFHSTPEVVTFAVKSTALLNADIASKQIQKFFRLTLLEPRLLDLYGEAAAVKDDQPGQWFCANEVFYGYHGLRGFKHRICGLVGWDAESNHPGIVCSDAYDIAYETIYEALPDCRDCICA
jgi:hypothetical protein